MAACSICVVGPKSRLNIQLMVSLLPLLRQAAKALFYVCLPIIGVPGACIAARRWETIMLSALTVKSCCMGFG